MVLVSTSPAGPVDQELPPPSAEILSSFENPSADPDWTSKSAVVDWVIGEERAYAGPDSFDEETMRKLIGHVWERTPTMASAMSNHFLVAEGAAPIDMTTLRAFPSVVVHGSHDPLFPPRHGEVLAEVLGAPLIVLPGVGHQAPPPNTWRSLTEAIATLAKSNEPSGA